MEKRAIAGDSPVGEKVEDPSWYLSTTRLEKPCGNLGGPSSKAEYYLATDSELVP